MPNRMSRFFSVALILSLPPLLVLAEQLSSIQERATSAPLSLVAFVEGVMVVGLIMASKERQRLLSPSAPGVRTQVRNPVSSRPMPVPSRPLSPGLRVEALVS